jgi:hypothetical protein
MTYVQKYECNDTVYKLVIDLKKTHLGEILYSAHSINGLGELKETGMKPALKSVQLNICVIYFRFAVIWNNGMLYCNCLLSLEYVKTGEN